MAEEAREQIGLDRVLFVPNRVSPFKAGRELTLGRARADMVGSAIAGNPAFELYTFEIHRPGPSYTIDTVRQVVVDYPDADLFFLTGTDAVRDLPTWREPDALIALVRFVAVTRPGVTHEEVAELLPPAYRERVRFMEMPAIEIAGTDLRDRVRQGRSIRYLTPPAVEAMIYEKELYTVGCAESRGVNS